MSTHSEDWRSLAEKASKEMNPKKLMRLLKQLSFALDDETPLPEVLRTVRNREIGRR